MIQSYLKKKPCCEKLLKGFQNLVKSASATYGNNGLMLFKDQSGCPVCTNQFSVVIQNARLEDSGTELARALVGKTEPPTDGLKTAAILAVDILEKMQNGAIDTADLLDSLDQVSDFCKEQLRKLAANNNSLLPGGGLYLINLRRPLTYLCDLKGVKAAGVYASAMSKCLQVLVENSGYDVQEIYERVKAAAPNQFFSLHHVGMESSINAESDFFDVMQFGFDIRTKKVTNLTEADIVVPLAVGYDIVDETAKLIRIFCSVKSVI